MITCDRPTDRRTRSLMDALVTLDPRLPRTELIHRALDNARAITGAERSTLFLLAPDGESLEAHGTAGPSVVPIRCAVDKGIAGACFRTGMPLVISDARLDPRFNPEIDERTGFETRAIVSVPLLDPESGVRGVLQALSSEAGRFEAPDADVLSCFAAPILLTLATSEVLRRAEARPTRALPASAFPLGESRLFREMLARAEQVGSTDANVLVLGETGAGKEVVARFLHAASARSAGPFVAVNCAALVETLAESEMFGHRKGAFTGADRDKPGFLAQADGGTLFLDEIGEMPKEVQAKLLRVMQDGIYHRVGDPTPIRVDVRFIGATNREVKGSGAGPTLREDFVYRLGKFQIDVPPLRSREGDSLLLFTTLLERELGRSVRVTPALAEALRTHAWPGNVREVERAVLHAALAARSKDEVDVADIREALTSEAGQAERLPGWLAQGTWKERHARFDRAVIVEELERCEGSPAAASRTLQLPRATLYRFRVELGIGGGEEPE